MQFTANNIDINHSLLGGKDTFHSTQVPGRQFRASCSPNNDQLSHTYEQTRPDEYHNKEELHPFMSEVSWPDYAIYRSSGSGPVFGVDIGIANNANSKNSSLARLGVFYPAPAAVQNPDTILAGTDYFSPDEVEVFYLDPTQ
ncbi:unnamed protein product [Porites lobata]|uniref:Uncharacterized protein n=1 Tax=Porites lobata TaxID=104759 RepID=A0ABN8RNK7_9CNID|nr:unnamed protein product [Porites lobata]